jgi:hypothetical protein
MSRTWAGGSTRQWRVIRKQVLDENIRENDGRCQIALPDLKPDGSPLCAGQADCVHHAIGKALTGDDPGHLVASCTPCNLKVGRPARSAAFKRVSSW